MNTNLIYWNFMLSNLSNALIGINFSGRDNIASQRYDSPLPHSPSPKGPRSRLESPSDRSPRQSPGSPGSPGSPSLPEDPAVQAKLQQIDREIKRLDEIEKLKGEIFDLQIMQVMANGIDQRKCINNI